MNTILKKGFHSFIYYDGSRTNFYVLTLADTNIIRESLPEHDESYTDLDVHPSYSAHLAHFRDR